MKFKVALFIIFLSFSTFAQKATVKGIVTTSKNKPIEGVDITFLNNGTTTNSLGEYTLEIPADKEISIKFSHLSFTTEIKKIKLEPNKTLLFNITLNQNIEKINEVKINGIKKAPQDLISINPADVAKIPGANQGVENVIMTLPGVNNNNELSTQYNVRGGNFDENLVYINGIEIYRPFLVRSGQQEGLSVINESMVKNIKFSAGGFQAKYGDKLSSVLDITYKTPTKFGASINASLLGGSVTVESKALKNKLSILAGVRYRNNNLFINSKDISANAHPNFTDAQTFLSYQFNPKFKLNFLGNLSINNYDYTPTSRRTKFGTITNPLELIVYYNGNENDQFKTLFGALQAEYEVNSNLKINLTTSNYHTIEEEFYDIFANYNLGDVSTDAGNSNFGQVVNNYGIGSQLNHARNELDALISNIELKTTYRKNNFLVDAGFKYQQEDFKDRIKEYEVIDSVGFNVRPLNSYINNQPYEPFTGPIVPYQSVNAANNIKITRAEAFLQFSENREINSTKIYYNLGARAHNWNVISSDFSTVHQTIFSIRGQIALKPDWEKDMLFKLAAGTYNQPPFYKEMRDYSGIVNPTVKAQKSFQIVASNDYSFNLWERPFKLTSEIYYKNLTDVNSYTVDNVKITYSATNNSKAYATGFDIRLNGEFVPGTQSWVSLGLLKTEENIANQGYIARPTDQRFKFAMLFQDYVPTIPNIKMYLNLVYNSGIPGGSPSNSNPYLYQKRLNPYKRADIGISYVFVDTAIKNSYQSLKNMKEFSVGVEIYNMFDVQNSITNTWVRDAYSKQFYGIPNYMTPRIFNIKLNAKF